MSFRNEWAAILAVVWTMSVLQVGCDEGGSSDDFNIDLSNSIAAFRGLGSAEATQSCLDAPEPSEGASSCACASGEIKVELLGNEIAMWLTLFVLRTALS